MAEIILNKAALKKTSFNKLDYSRSIKELVIKQLRFKAIKKTSPNGNIKETYVSNF